MPYDKARYDALRAAGKCVQCERDADNGKSRCRRCRIGINASERERQRKVALGRYNVDLCTMCGERPPRDENVINCGECLTKAAAYLRQYRGIGDHEREQRNGTENPGAQAVHASPGRYLSPAVFGRE